MSKQTFDKQRKMLKRNFQLVDMEHQTRRKHTPPCILQDNNADERCEQVGGGIFDILKKGRKKKAQKTIPNLSEDSQKIFNKIKTDIPTFISEISHRRASDENFSTETKGVNPLITLFKKLDECNKSIEKKVIYVKQWLAGHRQFKDLCKEEETQEETQEKGKGQIVEKEVEKDIGKDDKFENTKKRSFMNRVTRKINKEKEFKKLKKDENIQTILKREWANDLLLRDNMALSEDEQDYILREVLSYTYNARKGKIFQEWEKDIKDEIVKNIQKTDPNFLPAQNDSLQLARKFYVNDSRYKQYKQNFDKFKLDYKDPKLPYNNSKQLMIDFEQINNVITSRIEFYNVMLEKYLHKAGGFPINSNKLGILEKITTKFLKPTFDNFENCLAIDLYWVIYTLKQFYTKQQKTFDDIFLKSINIGEDETDIIRGLLAYFVLGYRKENKKIDIFPNKDYNSFMNFVTNEWWINELSNMSSEYILKTYVIKVVNEIIEKSSSDQKEKLQSLNQKYKKSITSMESVEIDTIKQMRFPQIVNHAYDILKILQHTPNIDFSEGKNCVDEDYYADVKKQIEKLTSETADKKNQDFINYKQAIKQDLENDKHRGNITEILSALYIIDGPTHEQTLPLITELLNDNKPNIEIIKKVLRINQPIPESCYIKLPSKFKMSQRNAMIKGLSELYGWDIDLMDQICKDMTTEDVSDSVKQYLIEYGKQLKLGLDTVQISKSCVKALTGEIIDENNVKNECATTEELTESTIQQMLITLNKRKNEKMYPFKIHYDNPNTKEKQYVIFKMSGDKSIDYFKNILFEQLRNSEVQQGGGGNGDLEFDIKPSSHETTVKTFWKRVRGRPLTVSFKSTTRQTPKTTQTPKMPQSSPKIENDLTNNEEQKEQEVTSNISIYQDQNRQLQAKLDSILNKKGEWELKGEWWEECKAMRPCDVGKEERLEEEVGSLATQLETKEKELLDAQMAKDRLAQHVNTLTKRQTELTELKTQIQKQLEQSETKNKALQNEFSKFTEKLEKINKQLIEKQLEFNKQKEKTTQLEKEIHEIEDQHKDELDKLQHTHTLHLKQFATEYTDEKSDLENTIRQLEEKEKENNRKLEEKELQIHAQTIVIENGNRFNTALVQEFSKTQQKLTEKQKQLFEKSRKVRDGNAEIIESRKEIDELTEKIVKNTEILGERHTKILDLNQKKISSERKERELQKNNKELQNEIHKLTQNIERDKNKLQRSKKKTLRVKQRLNTQDEKRLKLRTEYKQLQQQSTQNITILQSQLENYKKLLQEAQQKVSLSDKEIESIKDVKDIHIKGLTEEITRAKSRIQELSNKIISQTRIEALEKYRFKEISKQLLRHIREREQQLEKRAKELELSAEQSLQQKITPIEKDLDTLREERDKLKEENTRLNGIQVGIIRRLTREKSVLEQDLQKFKEKVTQLQQQITTDFTPENDRLKKQLKDAQDRIKELEIQVEEKTKNISDHLEIFRITIEENANDYESAVQDYLSLQKDFKKHKGTLKALKHTRFELGERENILQDENKKLKEQLKDLDLTQYALGISNAAWMGLKDENSQKDIEIVKLQEVNKTNEITIQQQQKALEKLNKTLKQLSPEYQHQEDIIGSPL